MADFIKHSWLTCLMLTCACAHASELIQPKGYARVAKSGSVSPPGRLPDVQGMWLPSELVAVYNAKKQNETARALNVYPQVNTQKPTRMDAVPERKYYPNYSLSNLKQVYGSMEQQEKGLARGEAQDRFFPGQYTPFFGNKNKGYPPAGPPKPAAAPMYLPPPPQPPTDTYGPPQGASFTAPSSPTAAADAPPSAPPSAPPPPPPMQPEPSPAMSPPEMNAPHTYMAPPPPMSGEDNHDHDHHHHHPPSAPMSAPSAPAPTKDDAIKYAPLGEHEYYTPPPGYEHHEHHEHHDHGYAFEDHHHDYEDYHHDHHHHVEPPTTMPPQMLKEEMRDTDKYSYYYIGRKLWYIPLYFSIYFIIYIAIVILKSIARHRIQYPTHYKTVRSVSSSDADSLRDLAVYVSRMLSEAREKYAE